MALTLVIRSGDAPRSPAITLDAPRVVIGRGAGCEVHLPDPSVSHRHASIRQRGTDYILLDEGSLNGTFVGGVRLSQHAPRVLRSGDLIRVGRIWVEVRIEQVAVTPNAQLATKEMALDLVAGALHAAGENAWARVFAVEGPDEGSELFIREARRPYVIGRGEGADLDLSDPDASRRHVDIERRGDRLFVRDLGSKNGALLDGVPLVPNQAIPFRPEAVLALGKNRFRHEDPVARALQELERAADERMDENESVPPPPSAELDRPRTLEDLEKPARTRRERPARRSPPRTTGGFTVTDWVVFGFSLVVLAASAAGLFWLFTG